MISAIVHFFLTLSTKSIWKSLIYKKLQLERFLYIYKEVFSKIWDYSGEKYGSCGILQKNAPWPRLASGIEHVPECKNDKERRWKRREFFVLVTRCPTRNAANERFFFLKIYNSRISRPYNLEFHKSQLILRGTTSLTA